MPTQLLDAAIYRKACGLVRSYVMQRSGSLRDFEDIFHEGVCIYLAKIKSRQLQLTCEPEVYILGVCKNLWLQELKKRSVRVITDIPENIADSQSDAEAVRKRKEFLIEVLERNMMKLSQKCQEIFRFRKEGLSCEEIAEKMNMDNGQISRNKMYTCKKRLLSLVYQDAEYEAFMRDE